MQKTSDHQSRQLSLRSPWDVQLDSQSNGVAISEMLEGSKRIICIFATARDENNKCYLTMRFQLAEQEPGQDKSYYYHLTDHSQNSVIKTIIDKCTLDTIALEIHTAFEILICE